MAAIQSGSDCVQVASRIGVAGGAQHSNEHLGPAHFAGRPVDHLHGVAGEVHEHPLAGGMHLAQRRLQPAGPFPVQIAEPGVAETVLAAGAVAVLLPQQRQRHVRPPQLAVHHRPVRHRPLLRRHRRRRRIQPRFQLHVVEPVGSGHPSPASRARLRHVFTAPMLIRRLCTDRPLAQPLRKPQAQHFAYFPHRQSLARHSASPAARQRIGTTPG